MSKKKLDYEAMTPEDYWHARATAGEALIKAMNDMIVCYRIGRNSGAVADRLIKAKATLQKIIDVDTPAKFP